MTIRFFARNSYFSSNASQLVSSFKCGSGSREAVTWELCVSVTHAELGHSSTSMFLNKTTNPLSSNILHMAVGSGAAFRGKIRGAYAYATHEEILLLAVKFSGSFEIRYTSISTS